MVIMLVAFFMLLVVGAMAALSIDAATIYTARSEAQLAADGAALAGARVLANSGMTSASDATVGGNAVPLAITVATQLAANNPVGGRNLIPGGICPGQEICVSIPKLRCRCREPICRLFLRASGDARRSRSKRRPPPKPITLPIFKENRQAPDYRWRRCA